MSTKKSKQPRGAQTTKSDACKDKLERIFPGFFVDKKGRLYFLMREFLLHHNLPSDPRLKVVIWEEIDSVFQGILVREIAD